MTAQRNIDNNKETRKKKSQRLKDKPFRREYMSEFQKCKIIPYEKTDCLREVLFVMLSLEDNPPAHMIIRWQTQHMSQ